MARTVGSTAEQTRRRILDAALELFTEHSYAGTAVRDIAERLGMTKAALYYHFASKEALLIALAAPVVDELDACAEAAERGSAEPAEIIRRLVDLFDDQRHLMKGMLHDAAARKILLDRRHMFEGLGRLERALAGSSSPSDLLRARCAVGAIRGAVMTTEDIGHVASGQLPPDPWPQLSEADRRTVTGAALAVLRGTSRDAVDCCKLDQ